MYRALVATDSRGFGLQQRIMDRLEYIAQKNEVVQDIYVKVRPESGTTIETLLPFIEEELEKDTYDLIIVAVGVNNLSHKNSNGTVTPIFQEIANMVDVLTSKYQALKNAIVSRPGAPPVALAQLVGIKFMRYNEAHGKSLDDKPLILNPYPLQQTVVNEGMRHINISIVNMNDESGVVGPWWQSTVHHLKGKNRYDRYKLLWDGLHAESNTKTVWACMVANSILATRRKLENGN